MHDGNVNHRLVLLSSKRLVNFVSFKLCPLTNVTATFSCSSGVPCGSFGSPFLSSFGTPGDLTSLSPLPLRSRSIPVNRLYRGLRLFLPCRTGELVPIVPADGPRRALCSDVSRTRSKPRRWELLTNPDVPPRIPESRTH